MCISTFIHVFVCFMCIVFFSVDIIMSEIKKNDGWMDY